MSLPGQQSVGHRPGTTTRVVILLFCNMTENSKATCYRCLMLTALIYDDLEVYPFSDVIESKKNVYIFCIFQLPEA